MAALLFWTLCATGKTASSGISVGPNVLNFGPCPIGATNAGEWVYITNTSRSNIRFTSMSVSSIYFTYSGPSMPLTLAPGSTFKGYVLFLPTAAQYYTGQLIFVRANGATVTVNMTGTGVGTASTPPTPAPTPVAPTITWPTPAAITYGTALSTTQLDATASTAGSFSYSPAAGTVLGAGSQTLSVTFTPTDTTDFTTTSASVTLTVNKATPTMTWVTPAAITYGTALGSTQLDPTANTAGSFSYSPAAGTVLGAGSQKLSATFTPTDTTDFSTTSGSVTLTVNKATPTITWPTPAAITSGTALSTTQLDATANTAGSFGYSPALGTVLSAGTQTLTATFTPTDTTDFNSATASVLLTVGSSTPATGTLTVNPASVSFGNVNVGASASQDVTVTNSGSGSVTISNLSLSGSGVGASGVPTGTVLTGGQSATLDVTFTANSTGSISGGVTISSNASNASMTIPVTATGMANSVSLSWNADSSATGGYNVYSSTTSGGPYTRLTSSPISSASYTDSTVQAGLTYYYVVTAINASTGMESSYSNQATALIP